MCASYADQCYFYIFSSVFISDNKNGCNSEEFNVRYVLNLPKDLSV